jgi:hypothetical protein
VLCVSLLVAFAAAARADGPDPVDFNFHVKPILSDRCFNCHGPDEGNRQADLRLDTKEGLFTAVADGEGSQVVKPGEPEASALYVRISAGDEDLRMPPPDSKLELSPEEIATLRRWIEQGAPWKPHWSFIPLAEVAVPEVRHRAWPKNEIDRFILARLEREGLLPAPQAGRERLVRRLSFDLTGLPPTLEEIDRFLADDREDAYERLVDRLLDSQRFGERLAVDWLDVARYADTYGYQADVYRDVWPYRDWVIKAFNENLPYDQIIVWQLAGDLLPNPTRDQLVATAFNRLHRQTNEGGSIEEEFRAEYVADRTNTMGAAFLGLTLECARCHEHKYDPISQAEYYQMFSFFNNIDECGLYSHFTDAMPTPTLLLTTDEQQRKIDEIEAQIATSEQELAVLSQQRRSAFEQWLAGAAAPATIGGLMGDYPLEEIASGKVANRADADNPGRVSEGPQVVAGRVGNGLRLSGENNVTTTVGGGFTRNDPFSIALWINTPDHKDRAVIFHRSRAWTDAGSRGYQLLLEEGCLSASLIHFWPGNAIRIRTRQPIPIDQWVHAVMTYDGSSRASGLRLYVDGNRAACEVVRDQLYKNITGGGANELTLGQRFRDRGFKNGLVDELQIYNRCLTDIEAAQVCDGKTLDETLASAADGLDEPRKEALFAYYLANHDEPYRDALAALQALRGQRSAVVDPIQEIMVMKEMPQPRPTFLLKRGAYDAPGPQVYPGTPASLPPPAEGWPRNRLGLARWLTDPSHPLTARVAVNRFWQSLFGRGLVATPEDFGSQGQLPTHPALLDWLARSFIDSGWDVKGLLKQIVMSATYRQTSDCSPELYARDPENVLSARGPRYRWPAEMIRDGALSAGGLLVQRLGGPPVKPYQPAGLWKEKSGKVYQRDEGEGSRRRSLYTYWKRTSPPPAMITLDAAKRDVCVVKRQTTATPLQSLVLLNDPQYVEAARALAERAMTETADGLEAQLAFAFRTLTSRRPAEEELQVVKQLYEEQREEFGSRPDEAARLLAVGDHQARQGLDPIALAAMTEVVQALMNYDETVTKR